MSRNQAYTLIELILCGLAILITVVFIVLLAAIVSILIHLWA